MTTPDFPTLTTAEIREKYLSFFEKKGCKRVASSSLIPDDPSLLLTNAGMNQFKQYYLGTKTMPEIGATSCQKCLRTNDIEAIGMDGRHMSFFEMLGNFSFGGYGKREACTWAFEFITQELQLPLERIYFTIFLDDDECHDIWRELGVAEDHISRLGEDDNFWAAGPTGPCGPCSEIFFDQGEAYGCGSDTCAPGCDCDRYLEFWNLVFTQYDRQEDGTLVDLPHKNVDTGMGLERISAIMQHKHTNYDGDVLRSLISVGEDLCHVSYGQDKKTDKSLCIMADHARAVTFMIADGILPSNEGRGYVLRRLLRRAIFHARMLGVEQPFLHVYIEEVTRLMSSVYPELTTNASLINGIISAEEERFSQTLSTGEKYLQQALDELSGGAELSGEVAFTLHDTYGFPIDLTKEIAQDAGYSVDMQGFNRCMTEQRERASAQVKDEVWTNFNNVWVALSEILNATEFIGYDTLCAHDVVIEALVQDGKEITSAQAGQTVEVVLNTTPFYAEMGGQIGDSGYIEADGIKFAVENTQKRDGDIISHSGKIVQGTLNKGMHVSAQVDTQKHQLICRNHTATHLLDAALKTILGDHVSQAGSLVTDTRLRFDFTHFEALSAQQIKQIEDIVNENIFNALPVITQEMSLEEAKKTGAIALFGEKYGERVRVVSAGEKDACVSRELCGGTHAKNTSELGIFKIISETSVGSNVRRIEAITSNAARAYFTDIHAQLTQLAHELKCSETDVFDKVCDLQAQQKHLTAQIETMRQNASSDVLTHACENPETYGAYRCVIADVSGLEAKDLRVAWDTVRKNLGDAAACVLVSCTQEQKVALLAAGDKKAVEAGFDAGSVIKEIAPCVCGRGGGRAHMAQAGGSDPSGISVALQKAHEVLA